MLSTNIVAQKKYPEKKSNIETSQDFHGILNYISFNILIYKYELDSVKKAFQFLGQPDTSKFIHISDSQINEISKLSNSGRTKIMSVIVRKYVSDTVPLDDFEKRILSIYSKLEKDAKVTLSNRTKQIVKNRIIELSTSEPKPDTGDYSIVFMIFSAVALLVAIFALKQAQSAKKTLSGLRSSKNDVEFNKINAQLNKISEIELIIESLTITLKSVESKIAEIERKAKNVSSLNTVSATDTMSNNSVHESKTDEIKTIIPQKLYFPAPMADGNFDAYDAKNDYLPSISFFEFNLTDADNAVFTFSNKEQNLNRILTNRDSFITPVCEIENPFINPRDFVIVTPGKVQKRGDTWKVLSKMRVRYV